MQHRLRIADQGPPVAVEVEPLASDIAPAEIEPAALAPAERAVAE